MPTALAERMTGLHLPWPKKDTNPVTVNFNVSRKAHMRRLEMARHDRSVFDQDRDFDTRMHNYLGFAVEEGLTGQHIVDSCADLAWTLTGESGRKEANQLKIGFWNASRNGALAVRERREGDAPRVLDLSLDVEHFAAIQRKDKVFEGRAWDPQSDKQYQGLREGDTIRLSVSQRGDDWEARSRELGVDPARHMEGQVGQVLFSPWVHWMYQFNPCRGDDFVPTITGGSEVLQMQRAGIYYTFPGYREKIRDNGFVAVEILNPQLV